MSSGNSGDHEAEKDCAVRLGIAAGQAKMAEHLSTILQRSVIGPDWTAQPPALADPSKGGNQPGVGYTKVVVSLQSLNCAEVGTCF